MAKKSKIYVEPAGYFPPEIVAEFQRDFEEQEKAEKAEKAKKSSKKTVKK